MTRYEAYNAKPRIAYLLQMFGIGGMPKWLYRLAQQLQDEFEFHFIATHSSYVNPDYREVAHVEIVPFRKWSLARYLVQNRIDIAQVANLRLYAEAAFMAKVPSVIERVDGLRGGAALNSKHGLDVVIASTKGIVPYLEELISPQKIRVIYNGVDLTAIDQASSQRFHFADEDVIVGRTSRLAAGKNISLLIAAVIELRKLPQYKHVRLVICGGDTTQAGAPGMLDRLRKEAAPLGDSAVFTGEVLDTKSVTNGFDIATCTSNPNNEGIPNSLIEAMAARKPIVASDVDDIPELVEHGRSGLLFENGNKTELIKALEILINDVDLRGRFGKAGRQHIEENFELKNQCSIYRELYKELLRKNGVHFLNRFNRAT